MTSIEYQALLEQLKNRPSSALLPLAEIRANFEKLGLPPEPDIEFKSFSIGSIPACWALAPGVARDKVVLFFHGGGYNAGSINSHKDLMGRISRASNCSVLAISYRLAPENPFPAALEDALKSYQWLQGQTYPPFSSISLVGTSAGGGLALCLCLKLKEENLVQPSAIVCICPFADLTFSTDSIKRNKNKDWINLDRIVKAAKDYYKDQDPKNPLISPMFGDFHGLPPILIQVGSAEVLLDEALSVANIAKNSGVSVTLEEWPEMVHCWQIFASKIPEGQKAIENIGEFLRKIP